MPCSRTRGYLGLGLDPALEKSERDRQWPHQAKTRHDRGRRRAQRKASLAVTAKEKRAESESGTTTTLSSSSSSSAAAEEEEEAVAERQQRLRWTGYKVRRRRRRTRPAAAGRRGSQEPTGRSGALPFPLAHPLLSSPLLTPKKMMILFNQKKPLFKKVT